MTEAVQAGPATIAAVDLGSNSFHMLVARPDGEELIVLDRLREMVQLARGLGADHTLDTAAQQRALECLARFGQRLRGLPSHAVRAVGTNTLRSARDAGAFLQAAEQALGHPIDVISGVEEARLVYLGVAHSVAAGGERRLVLDIGGGSTELIIGRGFRPERMESLHMGCISYTERWFPNGTINAKCLHKAQLAARLEIEPLAQQFRRAGWDAVIGASGTMKALARVAQEAGWCDEGITRKAAAQALDALLQAGDAAAFKPGALSAQRRAVFPGGAVIVHSLFEALGLERIHVADGALREGLLYDQRGRLHHEDVRGRSVRGLAGRYHVDEDHAARVADTATALHAQLRGGGAPEDDALLLEWGARLHEVGLDIAHAQYHKHGAYVIEHADLPGFSRQEQRLLASLVRAHRRKFPASAFDALPSRRRADMRRLALMLRLAVLLHRGRNPEPLPPTTLKADGEHLRLRFPRGWLEAHPLTRADLEQEAAWLEAAGLKLGFA